MNRKLEMEAVEDEENELLNKLSGIEQYFENSKYSELNIFPLDFETKLQLTEKKRKLSTCYALFYPVCVILKLTSDCFHYRN